MVYRRFIVLVMLLACTQVLLAQTINNKPAGTADFLKNLYDVSTLPVYASNTYSAETSTYDRTGMNNDGFAGTYSFIRKNADGSLVIFDQKGPGVINRIWTPTPTDDTMDFYIDDSLRLAFSIKYRDLFTGKVFPFAVPLCANQLGGYYCYLPIPFNVSCKIVLKAKNTRFHQIGYRLYQAGTILKSFSLPFTEDEKAALQKVQAVWNNVSVTAKALNGGSNTLKEINKTISLYPGQTITVFQSTLPGRMAGFELYSASLLDSIAKNIDIRITWDYEASPAVYCPLSDYFGYAFGKASMKGLLVGSDGKRHYSFFPMPFDKNAKMELVYRKSAMSGELNNVTLVSKIYWEDKKRDADREGKFYAYWNRENPVPKGEPYTMLQVSGKGHFAGVALQAQGLLTGITSFFEGDDSTVVDGQLRMHGTGSEDFFNGGWYALLDCWDGAMSLPMSGALDYSIPLCRTGGYRFFLNDKISFDKHLLQTIEHGPEHNLVPSDYTSVSYYYCNSPNPQRIFPSESNTRIYLPDTMEIYPQLMFTAMDVYSSVEAKWAYPLPAKTMFYTIKENSLVKMSLRDIPPGNYTMYMDYVKDPAAAAFSIWQRQTQLSEWIDANAEKTERLPMEKLADISLTNLNNSFSFHFNTKPGRDKFILNRIILIRKK